MNKNFSPPDYGKGYESGHGDAVRSFVAMLKLQQKFEAKRYREIVKEKYAIHRGSNLSTNVAICKSRMSPRAAMSRGRFLELKDIEAQVKCLNIGDYLDD